MCTYSRLSVCPHLLVFSVVLRLSASRQSPTSTSSGTATASPSASSTRSPLLIAPITLGASASYAILAAATVTNVGLSIVTGDVGISPGTAMTGFTPPGTIVGHAHLGDAVSPIAIAAAGVAYNEAAGRPANVLVAGDLGGLTLATGVYKSTSGVGITGALTLDARGDSNAVFIFQIASTLVTSPSSSVVLIGGAQACNIFWQVRDPKGRRETRGNLREGEEEGVASARLPMMTSTPTHTHTYSPHPYPLPFPPSGRLLRHPRRLLLLQGHHPGPRLRLLRHGGAGGRRARLRPERRRDAD